MRYSFRPFQWLATSTLAMVLLFFLMPTQQSCYYDNEEELYPIVNCDTSVVKYSKDVVKIMQDNCNSCHTGAGGVSGIPMETYSLLKTFATNGKLVARINDASNPMPPSGLLNACDRAKIKKWVDAGAKND